MEDFLHFVPPTSFDLYKGQYGKVGVIDDVWNTSALLFLQLSPSFVWMVKSAAITIKSYSPDLIVRPYLPDRDEDD
jgi:NAD(P)H-hydrate repair Nnr-like enzyme with NAD(P)H-hydrate dehydratase domain